MNNNNKLIAYTHVFGRSGGRPRSETSEFSDRMAPWSSQPRTAEGRSDRPKSVNIFVGFFLVLNTCIAFGFLGIPYGFFYSGFVASILTLLVIALATWSSATWEVETMARAEAVVAFRQSLREVGPTHQTTTGDKDEMEGNEEGELEDDNDSVLMSPEFCSLENVYPNFLIRLARSFEPSELCEIFFNRWVKYLYVLVMIIYCSLGYWATSTVVGSALATNIPFNFDTVKQCKSDAFQHHILPTDEECVNAYRLCLLIYGLIVVTLSLINLKDQAIFQMLLGFMRFVMIGAIVIYCIVSLIEGGNACIGTDSYSNSSSSSNHTSNLSNVTNTTGYFDFSSDFLLKFDWKGWVVSIPVFTFAFIVHQVIPTVTQPIKQKQYLHWLMILIFGVTTAAYLSVGIFVTLWFRGSVQETATLNWVTLTKPGHSPQLRALSYFIVLFPSVDICTSSPLVIHALANNVYTVLQDVTSRTKHKFEWIIRPILRFILAVIPLFPALFISNLINVLGYTGLSGFAICFLFPTALQLQSQRVCKKLFGDSYQMKRSEQQPCEQSKNCRITSDVCTETVPLLSVQRKPAVLDSKQLYMTPYSNKVFSHPVAVVILGTLGVILFLLGIVSLFVKPDTLHCQANQ